MFVKLSKKEKGIVKGRRAFHGLLFVGECGST